jgi:hypothetical protein
MGYAALITLISEAVYFGSKTIDAEVPVHLEVLLPAFVIGCLIARPRGIDPHSHNVSETHELDSEGPLEQRVAGLVSAAFMVLVGLSMPLIETHAKATTVVAAHEPQVDEVERQREGGLQYDGASPDVIAQKFAFPGWNMIAIHVFAITILSNVGKMFPVLCYRREVSLRERLAVAICMFPRGEVGAGVLAISLSYGIHGPVITVAVLSLTLNLLCSGLFIWAVKKLLAAQAQRTEDESAAELAGHFVAQNGKNDDGMPWDKNCRNVMGTKVWK